MNKNILLSAAAAVSLLVLLFVMFYSPQEEVLVRKDETAHISPEKKDISITHHSSSPQIKTQKVAAKKPQRKIRKKRDVNTSIKYVGMDHYKKYVIALVDENPEDKDINVANSRYRIVDGEIDKKQFIIKVPEKILDRPNLKLYIKDIKSGKSVNVNADFLNELAGMPKSTIYKVNIDTTDPDNVVTKAIVPSGNGAFVGIKR